MNLRQMECFLAVADELHFRRAADRLHLAPPSVSGAVAGLERSLGSRLVERTSRRVRLTPFGAEFAAAIRQPIEALHQAHRAARLRSAHRDLVVAHTPELGQLILPGLVDAWPGAAADDEARGRWRPVPMHTPEQLAAVADGEVDVGLCWSVPEQPGIASAVLGAFPLVAVLQASDPLASRHEVALTDLRTRQILITPRADNPYLESRLQADIIRAGIPRTHIEEAGRYDELAVHVATRGHVGVHPGPIALTNSLPAVVFRRIADASDSVRICAISRAEARTSSIAALVASLRSIVGSLDIDDKLT
ncbi:LysR family transcriptional regulator [Streptomyces sp. MK37H]|uniref:LysR family transcriptional regulator n=1 Tax=Streptomyces sp. MK37H TaxID=2699117 RepID=UPI001B371AEF|nr:LysR family transcriptional regulator [Streptomyces sp. MK37H]MBP8535845.1 LysR family transcriptional regulator [Streptomyces sp. MK37H]